MNIVLDTNRDVEFARGDREAIHCLPRAERVYLPFVVVAELRAGFLCGAHSQRNVANLTRFLGSPRVDVLYPDDHTAHQYARLFRQRRVQRTPIPTNDLRTEGLALQHGLHLFARNRHFDRLPQIPRV